MASCGILLTLFDTARNNCYNARNRPEWRLDKELAWEVVYLQHLAASFCDPLKTVKSLCD